MSSSAAIITISDKGAAGQREDQSGPLLADKARELGVTIIDEKQFMEMLSGEAN